MTKEIGYRLKFYEFRKRLDDAIAAVGGAAFVRTSLRSPKDSKVAIELQRRFARDRIASGDGSDNDKMLALLEGALRGMLVKTGEEAIALLSSSERVKVCEKFREYVCLTNL